MGKYTEFINELSAKTGLNTAVISVWVSMEQGVNNNILGIRSAAGPLMKFSSQTAAADATANLLQHSSNYAGIRASESQGVLQQAWAIVRSPWHLGGAGLAAHGGIDPYYLKGFVNAGIINNAGPVGPTGGTSTPITPSPSGGGSGSVPILGAWLNQIQFPVGHTLSSQDVEDIVNKLDANGWFGSGLAGIPSKEVTRTILKSHIGQPWDKTLQDSLFSELTQSAANASPLGNIDLQGALIFVAVILVGIAFLFLGGIIILKGPKPKGAAA